MSRKSRFATVLATGLLTALLLGQQDLWAISECTEPRTTWSDGTYTITKRPVLVTSDGSGTHVTTPGIPAFGVNIDGVGDLLIENTGDSTLDIRCSASLLTLGGREWLITAAHCVADSAGNLIANSGQIQFETTAGSKYSFVTNPAQIHVHPSYNPSINDGYDVSLIQLDAPADPAVPSYLLNRTATDIGVTGIVVGYGGSGHGSVGSTLEAGTKRAGLNKFEATGLGSLGIGEITNHYTMLTSDFDSGSSANDGFGNFFGFGMRDTGFGADEVGLAPGDSGGPTFIQDGPNSVIAGVHSHVLRLGQVHGAESDVDSQQNFSWGEFNVDARIMEPSVLNWVDTVITGNPTVMKWVGDGTGAGDWFTGSNWDLGVAPVAGHNLLIDSGTPVASDWVISQDTGMITIDGGDVTWNGTRQFIGKDAGHDCGKLLIKSGSLRSGDNPSGGSYPKFNVGDRGSGYVHQSGGAFKLVDPGSILQLAGGNGEGSYYISGGTFNVGKLGNGWDGRGEFRVIGDDATITLRGETGPGSQAYWQNNISKLMFEIGTGISKLDAAGSICSLGGTLEVSFTEIPTVGERFTLMEYGTLIHGFDSYDLTVDSPWGPDTVELALHYGDRSDDIMEVEVLAVYGAIPGDLNGDGAVNSGDLDIVRGAWEETVEAGCLPCGDPSGDGVVNSADLDIVRANWGAGVTPVPVPEPAVCSLLFAALALASIRRRR